MHPFSFRKSLTRSLACAITAGALTAPALAEGDLSAEVQALKEMVAQQQAQIRDLQSEVGDERFAEVRRQEIEALFHEVMQDASTRAAYLNEGLNAGHNGSNFFLTSNDGNFLLKLAGLLQFRYNFGQRQDPGAGQDPSRGSFELARTRFGFRGHVGDPSWQYSIWTGNNSSGGYLLLDAHITKKFDNGFAVQMGQFKVPFFQEWLISETRLQAVERSILTSEFSGGYTQGINVKYAPSDDSRFVFSINDGLGQINTNFTTEDVEGFAVTARGEKRFGGTWKQFADNNSFQGEDAAGMIGAAVHYQQGEYGTTTDEGDRLSWTADVSYEFGGANLFAAVVGSQFDGTAGSDEDTIGALFQAGAFVNDKTEVFARYEWIDTDLAGVEDLSLLTVGLNHFYHGHRVKFTADIGYAFNEINSEFARQGYQADAAGEEGQFLFRAQMQLLF